VFLERTNNHIAHRIGSFVGLLSIAIILVGCAGYASSSAPKNSASQGSIVVTPGGFNFQSVAVGQTLTQTMQISNTGSAPVQISALALSNNQFTVSGPSVPRTILAGANLQYTLAFTPTTAGSASGALNITAGSSQTPLAVSLSGTATAKTTAALQLTPASINFGNLALQTTGTQNVTLQNNGSTSVSINGVTVSGSGFGYADLSPGYSLSPNQKVTFQVWFKPQVAGAAAGTLSVLAANQASPATATLAGDGVTATPTGHTVQLSWGASSSSVVGYNVYRSEASGGPYSSINGSSVNALAYSDATVTAGTTYYYVVTAVDSAGDESVYSNQTTAAVPTP
jgi:hypothetical protein